MRKQIKLLFLNIQTSFKHIFSCISDPVHINPPVRQRFVLPALQGRGLHGGGGGAGGGVQCQHTVEQGELGQNI